MMFVILPADTEVYDWQAVQEAAIEWADSVTEAGNKAAANAKAYGTPHKVYKLVEIGFYRP